MRPSSLYYSGVAIVACLTTPLMGSALHAADATNFEKMARIRQPIVTNPNVDEWALIQLPANLTGSGIKVGVYDGYSDCRHPDLATVCANVKIAARYRLLDDHGTHVAGIVAGKKFGVAPGASIINYAVFEDKGWAATGNKLVTAWRASYKAGARIANMSFGCTDLAFCFSDAEITAMATDQPMLYIKAAGNDGHYVENERTNISDAIVEAALRRTLLVGSVDNSGTISYFSNMPGESCLLSTTASACTSSNKFKYHFIVAPGERIYSTMPSKRYGYMSGASMATPVVAGAAALLQQRWPALKERPEAVAEILLTSATDLGAAGVDDVYGYGLLNVRAAFQASGNIQMFSLTGVPTLMNNSNIVTSWSMKRLTNILGQVSVYDRFGRDYSLAQTGALNVGENMLAMRTSAGTRLLGWQNMSSWTQSFFAEQPQTRHFAMFGSAAELPAATLAMDSSSRMGVDIPISAGLAQFRMTGAGDPRADFAFDATMRPLAYFASTSLYAGAAMPSALIALNDQSRLMVYGLTTIGSFTPVAPLMARDIRADDIGKEQPLSLQRERAMRAQSGIGIGYWLQPDPHHFVGVNFSLISQKRGFYELASDMAPFQRPALMYNLGAAANRRAGDWEFSLSGEASHVRMASSDSSFYISPTTLVSAEASVRKAKLLFSGQAGVEDWLALSFVLPPMAVQGDVRIDFLERTADGLGRQARALHVPVARLGRAPERLDIAYRLSGAQGWSVAVTGGLYLRHVEGLGAGEAMLSLKMPFHIN